MTPEDMIAMFDQNEAALSNVAKLIAGYYNSLVATGLPKDLIYAMVFTYYQMMLQQAMGGENES